jgi:hypothetical protein
MTDQAIRVVAAGWYDDPADPSRVRWWNGVSWTEHTNPKPGARPRPADRDVAMATAAAGAATSGTPATAATAGVPLTRRAALAAEGVTREPDARRAQTGAIWLIGLIPVIAFALSLGAAYVSFYVTPSPFVWLVGFAPYLLGILWAVSDRRQLADRGFRAPNPAWALLTPVAYVIARRVRVPGNGPLLLIAITAVLAMLLPTVVWLSGAARPVTFALDVQQTAVRELVDTGRLGAVSCPPFVESLTPGSLFTCDATGADGLPTRVWVSIDSADGAFSLAPAV